MENRKKLYDFFKKEMEQFDLGNFFINDSIKKNNGAIGLITPTQLILTRNIDFGNGVGSGDHNPTCDLLSNLIYNREIIYSKEIEIEKIYLLQEQNILIRMFNESFGETIGTIKSIWIHFPSAVTETQIYFLKKLEDEYGEILKKVSQKQLITDEDPLVGFKDIKGNVIKDNSFNASIIYAEQCLLNKDRQIIPDEIIVGKTINSANKHL